MITLPHSILKKTTLTLFTVWCCVAVMAQKPWLDTLSDRAYEYNKDGKFNKSIAMYNQALASDTVTAEDRVYLYIFKANVYKWLVDYVSVERNLKLALEASDKTSNKAKFLADIHLNLALMYFDIHRYAQADSVMRVIRKNNFIHLSNYSKALIYQQEAYLLFLNKDYNTADSLYTEALALMESGNHCDTPIIYWKKLALYLAMGKVKQAEESIRKGLDISKKCGVEKYIMYILDEAAIHYAKNGYYEKAYEYSHKHDSVKDAIDQAAHLSALTDLEKEYQTEREIEKQQLARKTLEAQSNLNYLISALVVCVVFLIGLAYSWIRYRKSKRYRRLKDRFTGELLNNIEIERKRIASDLHDGVSHELLAVKMKVKEPEVQQVVNNIIQEIRLISRNLHPVMFDKLGLKTSLEQLAWRMQENTGIVITTEMNYNASTHSDRELQLYRIAQEALGNSVKYSDAIAIRVGLHQDGENLVLEVQDNGKGFDIQSKLSEGRSFGLQSIYQRGESLSGTVQFKSADSGTHLIVTIPIK
ncbi:MAG: ATP-binding protein [Bacteroidota bacterium]